MASASTAVTLPQNWLRGNLIGELCLTDALLIILHNTNGDPRYTGLPTNGAQLYARMVTFKNKYQNKLRKVIKREQWNIICPSSCISNSADWDITILKVVIQYEVLHLLPPNGGWENAIQATDLSTAADVCRSKDIRNLLKHGTTKVLANTTYYNSITTEIKDVLHRLGYKNMKLFNDLKTGTLELFTSQILKILEDKIDDISDKMDKVSDNVDDINKKYVGLQKETTQNKSDIYNNKKKLQTLQEEINDFKGIVNGINKTVCEIDRKGKSMFGNVIKSIDDLESRLRQEINNRFQKLEERVETLEHHQQELNPQEIVLSECLQIVSNEIGNDWKKLSNHLHLSTDGTSEENQPHLNMNKCFENAQNLITWKNLKNWLGFLERDDLVKKLQDETLLTKGISRSLERHRQIIFKKYEKSNKNDPFKMRTNEEPAAKRVRREEVFVDLTVVSQQEYLKEYSECENFIKRMEDTKQEITMDQLVETKDKFVLITGNAGIGKTELIDTVTLKWAKRELLNGKHKMPNIEALFPIKCRELNTMDFSSDNFQSILQRLFPDVFKEITIEDLQDISHKIMFVVDGLDEMMSIEQLNYPSSITNARVQKMVQFVRDILLSKNKVFSNQYSVAVGRPYISSFIEESTDDPSLIKCVYVCGFSKESVNQYIKRHCDQKILKKVTREIKLSENLSAMSHVPVYLWVICNIYKDDVSIETPRTITELMMYACLVFIRRHLIDNDKNVKKLTLSKLCERKDIMKLIKSISWMSFDSLVKKRVLFENQDLGEIIQDVEEMEKKTGFIVKSSNGELGDLYQFSHLVLQELFCGMHMFFSSDVKFSSVSEKIELIIGDNNAKSHLENCYPIVACIEGMIQNEKSNLVLLHFIKKLGAVYNTDISKGKKFMEELHQTLGINKSFRNRTYLRCCFESNCEIPSNFKRFPLLSVDGLLELRWIYNFARKISNDLTFEETIILFPIENLHQNDIESLAYLLNLSEKHSYIEDYVQIYEYLQINLKNQSSNFKHIQIDNVFLKEGIFLILPYLESLEILFDDDNDDDYDDDNDVAGDGEDRVSDGEGDDDGDGGGVGNDDSDGIEDDNSSSNGVCDGCEIEDNDEGIRDGGGDDGDGVEHGVSSGDDDDDESCNPLTLINKIIEEYGPRRYKLQNLVTFLNDDFEYVEAVCNTIQYLSKLKFYMMENNPTILSCLFNKVKTFSESECLKLKVLAVKTEIIGSTELAFFLDCLQYISNVVVTHTVTIAINEILLRSIEKDIDNWIDTNDISIEDIFGELEISVHYDENTCLHMINDFNKKYKNKIYIRKVVLGITFD